MFFDPAAFADQSLVAAGAADWDAVALSFYPNWGAGNSSDSACGGERGGGATPRSSQSVFLPMSLLRVAVEKLAAVAQAFPGKGILLAETSYAYQGTPPPGSEFPFTTAGQLSYTRAILAQES